MSGQKRTDLANAQAAIKKQQQQNPQVTKIIDAASPASTQEKAPSAAATDFKMPRGLYQIYSKCMESPYWPSVPSQLRDAFAAKVGKDKEGKPTFDGKDRKVNKALRTVWRCCCDTSATDTLAQQKFIVDAIRELTAEPRKRSSKASSATQQQTTSSTVQSSDDENKSENEVL